MKHFEQLAIIGPTASGKTSLAIHVAKQKNALILSLDSLAIYKEINIVSAKPTPEERGGIPHYGIDHLYPDEPFDVTTFINLYKEVRKACIAEGKNLVIVGGTSFYLKMLLEGISEMPSLSKQEQREVGFQMRNQKRVYDTLTKLDPNYMQQIAPGDTYRLQKALEINLATGTPPGIYFAANPPKPIIEEPLPIYEILWPREALRKRIRLRTKQMLQQGLIDEVIALEKKYTRSPNCMKAIGIKETLAYLDGIYDKSTLEEKIAVNTGRLAKRQETFNRSQFNNVIRGELGEIENMLLR